MRTMIPFNGNWTFEKPGEAAMPVALPHTWNAVDGQDGGGDFWRGECVYEKTFSAPNKRADEEVWLEFDGASASAKVTLNGHFVGEHHGGYSRFRFNITEYLKNSDNHLTVAVSNAACDTVYPQNADFTFYGGIYRAVRLIVLPNIHFDMDTLGGCGVRVTPKVLDDGSAEVHVSARTTGGQSVFELNGEMLTGNEAAFHIENPMLWQGRKNPHLYTLKASLYNGDMLCDSLEIPFGIRSFRIDPNEGFILNDESYPLRGVAMHQDWLGKGNAISEADMEESMRHIYDMGATTVRLAHYQHDQHTYDLCDRLGLVVWTEIPYISEHMDNARDNARQQMRELIEQNYNHPSIAVWGLSNEITMAHGDQETIVPFHKELNTICHRMDDTRMTTMACISPLPVDHPLLDVPDVLSYNHYFGWYGGHLEDNGPWFDRFHTLHPDLPVGVSEYGCENSLWHASHPEPGDYSNEYQMIYHESLIKQLFSRRYLWATHVWNMFDFAADAREEGGTKGRNNKGLVTFDRKTRKDAFYAYQAWLTDEPMLHLCGKEFVNRDGDTTEFVVYSNLPEVTLTVDGTEYRKECPNHFFHFTVPQPKGSYTVVASAGSLSEQAQFCHVTEPDPAYRFQQGTVLNWFDITTPEGYYSVKDLLKDITQSPEAAAFINPLLAEMTASRMRKAAQKEQEAGRTTQKSGEGISAEARRNITLQFSLLQLIRMGAPDMPKERIIEINRWLNRIPKKRGLAMQCDWIGTEHPAPEGKFAYFRLDAELPQGCCLTARITAAAHYRLWINGRAVCSGPCMGDQNVWYYDEIDLMPWLIPGVNRFAVQVICLDPAGAIDQGQENTSLIRMIVPDHRHRFAFDTRTDGINLSTGTADWRVWVDESACLRTDKLIEFLGAYTEEIDFHQTPADWKCADCAVWPKASVLESVEENPFHARVGVTKRYRMQPRPIPMLFEREESFTREIMTDTGLLKRGKVNIPPHTAFEAVLDAGQVKVTHPSFCVEGGDGAKLEITYFEKFQKDGENFRRDDWQRGSIIGIRDQVTLCGREITYEPFYVRTFRFIRIRLVTGEEGAMLHVPSFVRTGYPLTEDSGISSSASWVHDLWRMCAETLQNCMLSTYMDCPYYEQLQYIMDTRLQVLFHLTLSRDTRMARKALEDFHRSILPCGLLPGKYPTAYLQVISTFSFHYIFMVWEYYAHTGDESVLRAYRADCDRILTWFENHLTYRGLMGHPGFWPFVDWQPAWDENAGVPTALREGESTIISFMYAYALELAAKINEHSGRIGIAQEYRERKNKVCATVQSLCWDDKRQMYREGPAYPQFTQHAQAWAVLCGLGDEKCIRAAAMGKDVLPVTFSTANEWFRALEQTGLYRDYGKQSIQPWIDLIALDCKTCPETPVNSRSENHAWSAQPMLELIRGVAGIRQEGVGWEKVVIAPCMMDLPDLHGAAATPKGDIRFNYSQDGFTIDLPEGTAGIFMHPDGRKIKLHSGLQTIE